MIVKLKDLADIVLSNVDKKSKENEISVKLCNFTDVYKNWAITEEVSANFMHATATQSEIDKFLLHKGYVAITKDSETRDDIGVATYIADDFSNTILGYHCALIKPNQEKLDGKYLSALLHSPLAQKYFENNASGSGQRYTLTVDIIGNLPVPVIDIEKQKHIGDLLSNLDRKVVNNNKIVSELESMAKTIYDYWFLQFDFPDKNGKPYKSSGGKMVWNEELKREIPEGWTCYSIKDIFDVNKYGIGSFEQYDYVNYLDTSNLTRNLIGEYDKIISKEDLPSRAKRKINKNDVLFSVVRPNQEHFGIIKFPVENMIASTGFAVLSSKKVYINDILYLFLTSKDILDKLIKIADSSASSYPAINADDIMELKIALPMDERFKEFLNKKFDSVFTTVHLKNMENKELASLRDWLLPMLMNGQVTFKDEK